MSGGGGETVVQPSTTTTVQDIPAWEQGYVTDLLGQAQTIAAQPYQQFPGQQIAGFTPDQQQAFSNIEGMGNQINPLEQAATDATTAGTNTANSIYGAGAGDINAATGYNPLQAVAPYLGAASQYNSAAAAQPYLNQSQAYNAAAAGVATPQGIQSYMSPYTNDVVGGIQNEANLNWNQNIMPGVNNEFVGSGQYGSGRNAQVLGQAAGNFQTGLSSNIANALQSGYQTAGNQAATEAGILGNAANTAISGGNAASSAQGTQISNLLNQGQAAGSATQQQATNLLNQGTSLGNLAATQGSAQLQAGAANDALASSQEATSLEQQQALQAVGQQQQQLNQTNINTAMQNFQNQAQWPAQQTEYLNQIIRGLPAPSATTSATQSPAYSVSPLAGIGGAGTGALSLLGTNGQTAGTVTEAKKGGLINGYAEGGQVNDDTDDLDVAMGGYATPLDYADDSASVPSTVTTNPQNDSAQPVQLPADAPTVNGNSVPLDAASTDLQYTPPDMSNLNPLLDNPDSKHNNGSPNAAPQGNVISPQQTQQLQLLAMARGMLTPQMNGSSMAALGQSFGNLEDITLKTSQMQAQQNALNYQRQQEAEKIALQKEQIEQGRYTPVKDFYGNVTGMVEGKTGQFTPINTGQQTGTMASVNPGEEPSTDPQKAAAQILVEQGSVPTQVGNRFDIAGRNKQVDAYNNQALAAKNVIQQLDVLDSQTGKYNPGSVMGKVYGTESAVGMGGAGATARTEADKASTQLTNAFMAANTASNRSGIGVLNFDSKGVPNADMTDEARTQLIDKQKAIANSQIQRAEISNLYPRMQMSNVNAIMNTYEQKNPPLMPDGTANQNWMPYQDWLKAGRPDTTVLTGGKGKAPMTAPKQNDPLAALLAEKARRQGAQQ